MRGLTPAERQRLLEIESDIIADPDAHEMSDAEYDSSLKLCEQGRAFTKFVIDDDGDEADEFFVSDMGRLALRLWPATMATPGAGEGR